jgi:hypothetical protein
MCSYMKTLPDVHLVRTKFYLTDVLDGNPLLKLVALTKNRRLIHQLSKTRFYYKVF